MKKYFLMSLLLISTFAFAKKEKRMLIQDSVYKIVPAGESEKIMFKRHSGIYYLRNDSKDYKTLKAALLESAKKDKKIAVKANPDTMEIETIEIPR